VTLRLRLTLWYSAVLAVVLCIFGMTVYSFMSYLMIRQIDDSIDAASQAIARAIRVTSLMNLTLLQVPLDEQPGAASVYAQVLSPEGALLDQSAELNALKIKQPLDPQALNEDIFGMPRNVMLGNRHFRVMTRQLSLAGTTEVVGYLQTAASLRLVDAAQGALLIVLVGGGVLAVALAAVIGYFSAGRALRPLNAVTQTAIQITRADDLSRRIPLTRTENDEVGRLITAFNETLERLERLFNAQRRFMADVSHELRTPLTAIRGNVDLLRRMGQADPQSLEDIKSETERMTRLVGDLLLLAQADAGNLPLAREPVELDTLLLEVGREAQVIAGHVSLSVGDMDQATVIGDRDRLKQVILNLVTNALKFTPEGGKVTLCLSHVNNWARLTVTDTGLGIPPEDLPKIFDRFYRVDKARSRVMGGAGLGLSIAQRITQMHGGRIEAASEGEGQGTTFAVWLPLAPKRAEPTDNAKTQPVKRATSKPEPLRPEAAKPETSVTPPNVP
jgi:heavy metal sensor kinase